MGVDAETLARAIGARVKQERKGRDWTLDQLAEFASVSRRTLVNVEQGSMNPSIARFYAFLMRSASGSRSW